MYDVITIGSAIVDIFIQSDEFSIERTPVGVTLSGGENDKLVVSDFTLRTGGGGGNTAVGFARLGYLTAVITEVGQDVWAQIIENEFHQEFVATKLLVREKKEKTGGSVILLGKDGSKTVLVHRGASSMLDPKDIPADELHRTKWIHVSNVSRRLDTLETIFSISLKKPKRKISWNPGWSELEAIVSGEMPVAFLDACEVFIVNKEEWSLIAKNHEIESKIMKSIPVVVITDGKNGGIVYQNGESRTYSAKAVKSIDNTGAGDAFGVGFVGQYIQSRSIESSISWGLKNAENVVQFLGAKPGLCSKASIVTSD